MAAVVSCEVYGNLLCRNSKQRQTAENIVIILMRGHCTEKQKKILVEVSRSVSVWDRVLSGKPLKSPAGK